MIVVDVNALAYLWIQGPFTAAAAACLKKDPVWAAPLLWRSEFSNVLAIYLRKGLLNRTEAGQAFLKAEKTLAGQEFSVAAEEVLDLVMKSSCTAYDCEYVALARKLGVKLVTKDGRILRDFPREAVDLELFAKG